MPVTVTCPSCSRTARFPDENLGKQARCRNCQTSFTVQDVESTCETEDLAADILLQGDGPPPFSGVTDFSEAPVELSPERHGQLRPRTPQESPRRTVGDIASDALVSICGAVLWVNWERVKVALCAIAIGAVPMYLAGVFVVSFISESRKSPDQIRKEVIELEGKRRQREMEGERARKQRELEVQIRAIEEDMKKHPERYK